MSLLFFLFDYSLEVADSTVESRRFSPSPDQRSLCRPHTRATSDEGAAGEEQRTHRRRAQGGGQGGGAGEEREHLIRYLVSETGDTSPTSVFTV
jgi:hypothetical protein